MRKSSQSLVSSNGFHEWLEKMDNTWLDRGINDCSMDGHIHELRSVTWIDGRSRLESIGVLRLHNLFAHLGCSISGAPPSPWVVFLNWQPHSKWTVTLNDDYDYSSIFINLGGMILPRQQSGPPWLNFLVNGKGIHLEVWRRSSRPNQWFYRPIKGDRNILWLFRLWIET
jgi:hypothetical protein